MKRFYFAGLVSLVKGAPSTREYMLLSCPENSDLSIWNQCICNQKSYYDADLNKCIALDDFGYWRKVTGYFSGYPLSIEHNRFEKKKDAMTMCAKHNDCGGVTKLQSGEYECRTRIFVEREGEISFQKPVNFPVPMFTEEMIDPVLVDTVKNLHPSDFEESDKYYDAGQYQYLIDDNFEPKQYPGVHLGSFAKMTNYEDQWANFYENGADFLCPKARSTVMFFQCGPKNKLMYVQELSPCTYKYSIDVKCSGPIDEPTTTMTTLTITEPSTSNGGLSWANVTKSDVLQTIVGSLHPDDFRTEDRRYDGGQYQYFIDNDFQPQQEPGVNLGSFVSKNKTSDGVIAFFEDGASFFCPKPRSTMMIFKCGPKNKLTNVYEFLPCVYKFFVDVECPESLLHATTTETPPPDFERWPKVDGWFAEYPSSIGKNRFYTWQQAFVKCTMHEDCGGISQNYDGSWECRAWKFVQEDGAVSYAKPDDFHSRL